MTWPHGHAEAQARPAGRQARAEAELSVEVAPAAEPGDDREPGESARGDVDAVGGVAVRVGQVDGAGALEVLERGVRVADLGRDHALDAGGQRRVAGGQRVVVVERAADLVGVEVWPTRYVASTTSVCLITWW